jgi:ABC-type polysaccharide/polyol phosphate export permease
MTLIRHYDAAASPKGWLRHLTPILGYPALVWQNRFMMQNFLRRDLMGRVHGSFLGFWWILLHPLFLFALYYVVFGVFFRTGGDPREFAIYLFSGIIVFHSLVEATTQCSQIVVDNGNLVKKVAFPSEVLPIHVALVSQVLYGVGASVCLVAGMLLGVLQPGWTLLGLPLLLLLQFLLTVGIGLFLANAYVFVRDTAQIWRIVAMAWQFLSPVFWTPDLIHDRLPSWGVTLLQLSNPAYSLIMAHRLALGGQNPLLGDFWTHLGIVAVWSVAFLLLGYGMFISSKHKYADVI